jgi:hypothetical protein
VDLVKTKLLFGMMKNGSNFEVVAIPEDAWWS